MCAFLQYWSAIQNEKDQGVLLEGADRLESTRGPCTLERHFWGCDTASEQGRAPIRTFAHMHAHIDGLSILFSYWKSQAVVFLSRHVSTVSDSLSLFKKL
jgi:hypothetical protein